MTRTGNGKKYALIAAVCFAAYAFYLISLILSILDSDADGVTAIDVFHWITVFGMPVALFMKNKKAVIAVFGANAFISLVRFFINGIPTLIKWVAHTNLSTAGKIVVWCSHFIGFFLGAVFAAITVLAVLSLKGVPIVSKNLVGLSVFVALSIVLHLVILLTGILSEYVSTSYPRDIFVIIRLVGCFIIGLWLKDDAEAQRAS